MGGRRKVKASGEDRCGRARSTLINDLEKASSRLRRRSWDTSRTRWCCAPVTRKNLRTILGVKNWKEILDTLGLTLYETDSDKLAEGDGLLLQRGAVGVMGVEDPISTKITSTSRVSKRRCFTPGPAWLLV